MNDTQNPRPLLEQMLARIKKSGSLANVYVGSALVGGFSRLGSFDHARKIFEQMTARNAASMNGLMVGLVDKNVEKKLLKYSRRQDTWLILILIHM